MSDDLINKIYAKVEEIAKDVTEIKIGQAKHEEILIKQEENIKYHIKRTDLLEAARENDNDDNDIRFLGIAEELKPLQRAYNFIEFGIKGLVVIASCVGLFKLLSKFFHF